MKTLHFFPLLLAIVFAGCTHDNNNTVVIHSVPADSIFTEIGIYASLPSIKQPITFKGGTTCRFETDTVETRYLNFFSNGNHLFSTQVFITPGDSVSFKTAVEDENSYDIIFEGENAAHYNYATRKNKFLSQENDPDYFSNPDMDLLEYKEQVRTYRDKENEFLKSYKKKYTVSEDFINCASAEINNYYALKLYQAVYFNKCKIIPKGYLDDAVITQNPLSSYALTALKFKYIYCSTDTNIERIYSAILNDANSKFHSNLLSILVAHFAEKGDRVYQKSFLRVMEQIEKTSTDSTLLSTVQEYKPYYLLSGTVLPDSILDKTYLRPFQSKQKITLRQFFNNYKNTAMYLDFWASWCAPCRYIIRASVENKHYLTEKFAVAYISIDGNENEWLKAVKDDNITKNQYLLLSDNGCSIRSFLKINSIPRYVLFNKKHEIEILNAPRPINCEFEELKKMIEHNPEKYISEKPVTKPNITKKEVQKETVFRDCADSTKFFVKTIYHDNFGTFSSATNYTDAWGVSRTPVKNLQTTYSPYNIPSHKTTFGWCDDGYYIISSLKSPVLPYYMKGGMTKDASGDSNGAVFAINVAKNYKGEIYRQQINNLVVNTILYFEVSIANASYVDNSTPPQVEIRIEKPSGELLGNAHSNLTSADFGWQKINIDVPPTAEESVVLRVISTGENWGDGCDLLMDDIIFRTCEQR